MRQSKKHRAKDRSLKKRVEMERDKGANKNCAKGSGDKTHREYDIIEAKGNERLRKKIFNRPHRLRTIRCELKDVQ